MNTLKIKVKDEIPCEMKDKIALEIKKNIEKFDIEKIDENTYCKKLGKDLFGAISIISFYKSMLKFSDNLVYLEKEIPDEQ